MAITKTAAKFRKTGDTLDYTASENVAAGAIVKANGLICMAQWDIHANTNGVLKILHRGEVIEVATDEAIGTTAAGTAIYVTSAGLVSKTESGNTLLGHARAAVGASDLTFEVVCA